LKWLAGDRFVISIAKRLGEEWFFFEAFAVFRRISDIFRVFCLVVFGFFVYLQTVKGKSITSYPEHLNPKKL
jgi:hypothetical protein